MKGQLAAIIIFTFLIVWLYSLALYPIFIKPQIACQEICNESYLWKSETSWTSYEYKCENRNAYAYLDYQICEDEDGWRPKNKKEESIILS